MLANRLRALAAEVEAIEAKLAASAPRGNPEGECHRKKAYRSPQAAGDACRYFAERDGKRQRVYACPHCGLYHLTTMNDPMAHLHGVGDRVEVQA